VIGYVPHLRAGEGAGRLVLCSRGHPVKRDTTEENGSRKPEAQ